MHATEKSTNGYFAINLLRSFPLMLGVRRQKRQEDMKASRIYLSLLLILLCPLCFSEDNKTKPEIMHTTIQQSMRIHAKPSAVFEYVADPALLKTWWPKDCTSERKVGGKLTLSWFNGSKLDTTISTYAFCEKLEFGFYTENLAFSFKPEGGDTIVEVTHSNVGYSNNDVSSVAHVAECWGSLLVGLKVMVEHHIDVRQ
jgi:uncharacterized protein YndB with AHSA1/START domain